MALQSRQTRRQILSLLATTPLWLGLSSAVHAQDRFSIVAMGDSLTAGFGLPPDDAFTSQLQVFLDSEGVTTTVVNAGVSGDTSKGGLARVDWSVPADTGLVILELGANDALRGISPDETFANLDSIISRLLSKKVPVLLTGMLAPPNMGDDYGKAFNAIYPALAKKHDVPLYPFFLEGVAGVPELNQADGIHPNATGTAEIVKRLGPVVASEVRRLTS